MSSGKSEFGSADESGWMAALRKARFSKLLIALSLLLFFSPCIEVFRNHLGKSLATLLVVSILAVVLVAAALAVSETIRQARVTLAFAAACIVLTWSANLTGSSSLRIAQDICTIGFLTHVVRLIVRVLFRQGRADYDTIAASICGYLLIGVAFAVTYSLVREFDASAFRTPDVDRTIPNPFHFGDQRTATSLYFSFVTLTTLGFGDITPASLPARMLTTAEAIVGQLYLVVLVARLVGLHITQSDSEDRDRVA